MGVGAYLKTVLNSAVVASDPSSLRSGYWQALLGGVAGSLMLCTAVAANPLPSTGWSDAAPLPHPDVVADGLYLYGSAPEPNTLGAAYMVFEAQDSHLVGAMFMPQSSFDCFQGYRNSDELALQITNSYTQEVYGYAIALVADDVQIAASASSEFVLALDGFYQLETPGEAELAILATCQAGYSSVGTEL